MPSTTTPKKSKVNAVPGNHATSLLGSLNSAEIDLVLSFRSLNSNFYQFALDAVSAAMAVEKAKLRATLSSSIGGGSHA